MTSRQVPRPARGIPWLVVAGVLVAALSLRGPIVAPTPVLRLIEDDLDIGATIGPRRLSAATSTPAREVTPRG